MSKLLKAKEVSEQMGISEERVFALAREGILPSVRLGQQVRFSTRALEKFIESGGQALPGGWKKEK